MAFTILNETFSMCPLMTSSAAAVGALSAWNVQVPDVGMARLPPGPVHPRNETFAIEKTSVTADPAEMVDGGVAGTEALAHDNVNVGTFQITGEPAYDPVNGWAPEAVSPPTATVYALPVAMAGPVTTMTLKTPSPIVAAIVCLIFMLVLLMSMSF
ncbi:hypothetical protein [Aeromicrobium fastidiosum]|uniref:Uncharacterized protein n=1 Tax=Aeromicrobium fastidiosum TaxID=52699 RepID=A0A641ARJ4_9ACTN|nr:hypothetical protein [Aeromicrobium fastidiosum]KAA1380137.1 hypothetical protein ESP62_002740 [Aeromicrobium fastidiosum]MBP2389672.1 hypothetical protein [Aeromicrobium fastidiosum]